MGKIIAFVPLRGGSKSIPLKNIKELCGKPLVYWCLNSLEKVKKIDEVIIATDSDLIEDVVKSFKFNKTRIYRRNAENAQDDSSTESVMLEFIKNCDIDNDDTFILVQATSPLTESKHFEEAIELYEISNYDSILSCVRNYRFFWNENGTSKNYDYKNRPRRQCFSGELMENGAFYINSVKNILDYQNRLSGQIGIYEMPEYTATEIDEPDDWTIIENLVRKYIISKKKIKLFICDVDGVLTDGGMYYSENGDELKKFNTRDGMAFELLRNSGIKTGIITSENTEIVKRRAVKIKSDYLYQQKNKDGKLGAAIEICKKENINLDEVAYIGDDINCYELLKSVLFKACPSDASTKVKQIPQITILNKKGGEGVVREYVELLFEKGLI